MKIIYTKSYDNTVKKLKKHEKELNNLHKIIRDITNIEDFKTFLHLPSMICIYKLERLRHINDEIYSLNLCQNGGMIRLLVKPNNNCIVLLFISYKHYEDFSMDKVIYYDE